MAECFGPIAEKAGKLPGSETGCLALTETQIDPQQDWAEFAKAMKKADRRAAAELSVKHSLL